MSPYIPAIASFTRCKNTCLCILSGFGIISNIMLRQPSNATSPGATVTFYSCFEILFISALLSLTRCRLRFRICSPSRSPGLRTRSSEDLSPAS
ncbi:hypothetical protein AHAS_Ahas19G0191100 [Arachis hypogaea]